MIMLSVGVRFWQEWNRTVGAIMAKPVYSLAEAARLTCPGNSPDLNLIEPSWGHLKCTITIKTHQQQETSRRSIETRFEKPSTGEIQAWIEQIPLHIQRIIDCDGGK